MNTFTHTDHALVTIAANIESFGHAYPHHNTVDGVYPLKSAEHGEPLGGNTSWTTGFWPGMLWLAYDISGDERFHSAASSHVASFVDRADRDIDMDHHDMGFLYTLSCTTAWRMDRDQAARRAALIAAEHLMARVLEPAGIIQAWGDLSDPEQQGRTIIDSLMNLPLLYWATDTTGDARFADAALRHATQLAAHIVRADDSTFHTFYWDVVTGEPLYGRTDQGFADDSCWARGQAWGIYGFTLSYLSSGDTLFLDAARRCADYFLSHLPSDHVPYWDLGFGDGDGHLRDSSAAAIAVCGFDELARATGEERYRTAAVEILDALAADYTPEPGDPADCLLLQGVYHWHAKIGMDEGNLWGDYYYLEALARRADPEWKSYWRRSPQDAVAS
ncbi:glycoside hydrolase family 88 protein [Microbacterium lacus]|uniref:glycoside hydrolase family 88 protein n=1 Tax=Microbacterium lacus TaxID=415217 RepID=UPI003850DC33